MKITHVETHAVRIPLKPERRMVTSLGQHVESNYVLVRIGTDQGIEGVGEATVMPIWSGETVWGAKALIDRLLGPAVLGCDPTDEAEIDRRLDRACLLNPFAKSAVEMACWDIHGKAAGKPVYELLGGPARPRRFKCRFSMGAYDLDRARRVAAERVEAGFTTIKVKVGLDRAGDLARVRAVREVIGEGRELTIDANGGWDAESAIASLSEMEPYGVSLDEQPVPAADLAGMARVRRETRVRVMADESCFTLLDARQLVHFDCADVFSVYPGKNGGIGKTRRIVEYAESRGIPCTIGSNLEWDVATAAMAHVVVGCRNMQVETLPGDALGPFYHEFSIAREPVEIDGPWVTVPDRPGLGIEVDWSIVAAHRAD
jgi:muconate cycloisomerase